MFFNEIIIGKKKIRKSLCGSVATFVTMQMIVILSRRFSDVAMIAVVNNRLCTKYDIMTDESITLYYRTKII